ncbi:MAG: DnaA regulatory inactivator Hda [Succinivibrio sp.]
MTAFANQPYQQILNLKISDRDDFSSFVSGRNQPIVQTLRQAVENTSHEFYFIFGPHGCGKTHLLNALFQTKSAKVNNCFFLDLNVAKNIGPFALEINLPKIVILDNVDAIAGDENFELALFALYNRWYDSRSGTLIMSSSHSFDTIAYNKKDLNTRMSSGIMMQMEYLSGEECIEALKKRAKERGFYLPDNTASFLVRHCNHDMRTLVNLLDRLEKAQLEHSHELTIPFVKMVLSLGSDT